MKISFFEEFPNKESLSKLELIDFSTKLFLADYSIEGYKQYKKELQKKYKNLKEVIWWPVLNVNEGYWLSPFSKRKALLRIFHKLTEEKIPIMWDAEFPRKKVLVFTQMLRFFKNKKLIIGFLKKYKGEIYTAEYAFTSSFMKWLFTILGLFFDSAKYNNRVIKMFYTSMHHFEWDFMKSEIESGVKKYKDRFLVGLGVIATGIKGDEKLLSAEELERDLKLCKELGINEVVLFRLGGLNKDYINVIEKFV